MGGEDWDSARSAHLAKVQEIEAIIEKYGYGDTGHAAFSDEKIKLYITRNLRHAKAKLRDLISLVFQFQADMMDDKLKALHDDIDHFSDSVKVSPFKWKELPFNLLEHLIDRDYFIIKGVDRLMTFLENLEKGILSFEEADHKVFDTKAIDETVEGIRKQLRELTILFKEREALFQLEGRELETVFREVREEIAKKY